MKPTVISTWKHGLGANKCASKILSNNGLALNAVEIGVKVTESDIKVRTVGYGGYTDNLGHVTLDASIMDHNNNAGSVLYLQNINIDTKNKVYLFSNHSQIYLTDSELWVSIRS